MYSSFVDDILVLHQSALYNIAEANPLAHSKLLFVELNGFTIVNLYIFQVLSHKNLIWILFLSDRRFINTALKEGI